MSPIAGLLAALREFRRPRLWLGIWLLGWLLCIVLSLSHPPRIGIDLPEGDKLGFVILVKDGLEVMYQSKASVQGDIPALAASPMGGTFLFMEVSDLNAVIAQLGNAPQVFPRRKTFYGMDEIGVREPGGNAITFAMPVA